MKKGLLFITGMLCLLFSLHAQQPSLSTIHGIVEDASDSRPLAGTSVVLVNGQGTTVTDTKGYFSITFSVPSDSLIITRIGYKMQHMAVRHGDSGLITIRLQPVAARLHEIVVSTGYQKIPKERATGSFEFIDNSTLNQQVGSDVLSRIDGVSNAVLFPKQNLQKGPDFMIRGLSTINGPKDPLIVVDNFPYDGDINNINPNDVESITILKDAAATSIWGTRAGNGVVVITTKRGHLNQPLNVDINANVIITGKPNLSSLRTISSSDYIDVEQMLFDKGYYDKYLNDTRSYPAVSPVVEILEEQKKGVISASEAGNRINSYRSVDTREQYEKYMYQQAVTQQYSFNLHGGSHNMAYYMSAGYDKEVGQLNNENNRLTFRTRNTYSPVKNLDIRLGAQYTQVNGRSGKPTYGSIGINQGQWQIPYLQFADQEGEPLPVAMGYRKDYIDSAGNGKLLDWNYYPLNNYKHNTTTTFRQDMLADIGLNYKFYKDLSIDINYLYERQNVISRNIEDLHSYEARDLINRFSQIDRSSGKVTYIIPKNGILSQNNTGIESKNFRSQINYNHTLGRGSISAIAGSEIRQTATSGNDDTYYGYNSETDIVSGVDFSHTYPTLPGGRNSAVPGFGGLSNKLNRYVSFYANASYTYDRKYVFSASGRRDASNLFGVSTNNKWAPLWSAGLAWNISNESFYKINWLPYLKLRVTDGFSGNTDPSKTGVTTLVLSGPLPPANFPTSRVNQFPNPDLRWEKVQMINIGIDFKSKNQVVTGSVEGYLKKGSDLYGSAPFDPTAGLNGQAGIVRNIANMQGKGIDLSITSININRRLKWYSQLLLSYNTSKTTKYFVDSRLKSGSFVGNGYVINPLEGKPLYSIIALPWAGLDDSGNPLGFIGKETSTDYYNIVQNTPREDLVYKSSLPVFFGALTNTFKWQRLILSINIGYNLGYYFMKPSLDYSTLFGNGAVIGSSDFSKRWRERGDELKTDIPSMVYPVNNNRETFYKYSKALITHAGNIRLKYVNLSYEMDKIEWNHSAINHLQIYINASDLGILWRANKYDIDPNYVSSIMPGKTFAIGIKLDF